MRPALEETAPGLVDLLRDAGDRWGPLGVAKTAALLVPGARLAVGDAPVLTQNDRGEWVPAIPEPLYVGFRLRRTRCGDCSARFRSVAAYRGHYALVHVLGLS